MQLGGTMDTGFWIGVDTGGTFTDALAIDTTGRLHLAKTPSTPRDLSVGIMTALNLLAESSGIPTRQYMAATRKLAHGTTATVNAMVQRTGARVGLITTRGFRDHLILMKAARGVGVPDAEKVVFHRAVKPAPIVPYDFTEEVTERIDYAGRVILRLDEDDVRRAIRNLLDRGAQALAVSLLWSFRNPAHEQRVVEIIREFGPDLSVSAGHALVPVIGEYERTTTAVINAYLGPVLDRYVHSLQSSLAGNGFDGQVLLMQSDGGLVPGSASPARAVTTMLSGLAAGVLGARHIGERLKHPNLITIDMGGTSFEVGLVHGGRPLMEGFPLTPRLAAHESRWRIAAPTIDITAIGAGGGSIARVVNGILKVGPDSAGAEPGPACYGRGGERPTVTDAFLVLGYLNEHNFLGGRMKVDKSLSVKAIEESIAKPLGIDVIAAADGIYRLVISHMADLIRKVTIERGYDVRDFVMMTFGGSGPVHAGVLGAEIKVPKVIIPGRGMATALSAYGLVTSDLRHTTAQSHAMADPVNAAELACVLGEVRDRAARTVRDWGVREEEVLVACSIDMRFKGQVYTVNVPVPSDAQSDTDVEMIFDRFISIYERQYGPGTAHREAGIELVTFRAEATGLMTKPELPRPNDVRAGPLAPRDRRTVYFDGKGVPDVPVYAGDGLISGDHITAPAIIEYSGNTIVVHPGQAINLDDHANLVFTFGAAS
jgi:N-methylhydantoinase A